MMEKNELVVQNHTFPQLQEMAQALSKSGLFPSCKRQEDALALMLLCQAEGLHPAQAVRRYHIINGTATMRADAMLSEFQRHGGKVQWERYDGIEARAVFSHPAGGSITFQFTLEQARKAGLCKAGGNWEKFPDAMLRARCVSGGIRMVLPGILCGIYTPEEVQDFEITATVIPATPTPAVVSEPEKKPEQEKPKKETKAKEKPPVHPALISGQKLFSALPDSDRGPILNRACKLFGSPDTKSMAPEKLGAFGALCEALLVLVPNGIDAVSSELSRLEFEAMEKEQTDGN